MKPVMMFIAPTRIKTTAAKKDQPTHPVISCSARSCTLAPPESLLRVSRAACSGYDGSRGEFGDDQREPAPALRRCACQIAVMIKRSEERADHATRLERQAVTRDQAGQETADERADETRDEAIAQSVWRPPPPRTSWASQPMPMPKPRMARINMTRTLPGARSSGPRQCPAGASTPSGNGACRLTGRESGSSTVASTTPQCSGVKCFAYSGACRG